MKNSPKHKKHKNNVIKRIIKSNNGGKYCLFDLIMSCWSHRSNSFQGFNRKIHRVHVIFLTFPTHPTLITADHKIDFEPHCMLPDLFYADLNTFIIIVMMFYQGYLFKKLNNIFFHVFIRVLLSAQSRRGDVASLEAFLFV